MPARLSASCSPTMPEEVHALARDIWAETYPSGEGPSFEDVGHFYLIEAQRYIDFLLARGWMPPKETT